MPKNHPETSGFDFIVFRVQDSRIPDSEHPRKVTKIENFLLFGMTTNGIKYLPRLSLPNEYKSGENHSTHIFFS